MGIAICKECADKLEDKKYMNWEDIQIFFGECEICGSNYFEERYNVFTTRQKGESGEDAVKRYLRECKEE